MNEKETTSTGGTGDVTIQLRDRRRLLALVIGKSDGFPIFHCHGNGSSRLDSSRRVRTDTPQGTGTAGDSGTFPPGPASRAVQSTLYTVVKH